MFLTRLILALLVGMSLPTWAAKTYISVQQIELYDAPDGELKETWPNRTLFTSSSETTDWIKITGHFPEGEWQPLTPALYVPKSIKVTERAAQSFKAPKTQVYKSLSSSGSKARAYMLKQEAMAFSTKEAALNINEAFQAEQATATKLDKDFTFTSSFENDLVIKVTGHFPEGRWQKLDEPVWLAKPVLLQNRTQPRPYKRDDSVSRFVVIDKTEFNLTLYELENEQVTKVMKTPVALGYDRCLSEQKGGKCYYTPEGVFEIEFKLFDPDGINWCIPKKMEAEFKSKIARGERCWRGVMGNHALHFGQSLFLHGTSNPNSIGSRSTHGCVRLRNPDISILYRALQAGDKVIITDQPETLDFAAIVNPQATPIVEEVNEQASETETQVQPPQGSGSIY